MKHGKVSPGRPDGSVPISGPPRDRPRGDTSGRTGRPTDAMLGVCYYSNVVPERVGLDPAPTPDQPNKTQTNAG